MRTIQVNVSESYSVYIGREMLSRLGKKAAKEVTGRNAALISDRNTFSFFGDSAVTSLEQAGFRVFPFIISPGEGSKDPETFLNILDFMARHHMHRDDCVVALGGGVVGDLAGFSAACFMRGIACIQAPTTLLSMVDSSVGGKTAINLPAGKNLCGVFSQPKAVLCDTATLGALPESVFQDGCSEVIKYGILYDEILFSHLEETGMDFDRDNVISRCVELKRDAVQTDEFDLGLRRKLNLGHTIGHTLEAESNYKLPHGQAVSIGIAVVTRAAMKLGYCQESDGKRILSILEKFGLPTTTNTPVEVVFSRALSDKKAAGAALYVILPRRIGQCDIVPMDDTQLLEFIKAGL